MQHVLVYDMHIVNRNGICFWVETSDISQEKAECIPELANIISGSIKYRRADGHFSEDVGLGHPPAQDISTVGRLCALILSVDEKDINV